MGKAERYSEPVVRGTFRALRLLHHTGVTGALYCLAAFCMIPLYIALIAGLNRLKVVGRERVPDGGGFFVLSNHISALDGQAIGSLLFPHSFWFPAKAEFYPGWLYALGFTVLTGFRSFPVRRGEHDVQAAAWIAELLRGGSNVLLFPEGTRSKDGRLGPGKPGVGAIVLAARPRVVPVYLEGFERVLHGRPLGQELSVVFGRPMALHEGVEGMEASEARRLVANRAMEAIRSLQDELHGQRPA